jgi:AraC-like DNA-binding protein
VDWLGPDLIQPVPASLEHIVEFEFEESPRIEFPDGRMESAFPIALVGSHTRPGIKLHLRGHIQSFAIFFEPLGLWQLFRVPPNDLADGYYEAQHALGPLLMQLWQRLGECARFQQRVALTERYLLEYARRPSGCTPMMSVARHIFRDRELRSVTAIASGCGLSTRQFERRFYKDIGITPKLFGRISRFQMALDRKLSAPERSWLSIAHEHGYHDQMHMIRDFNRLAGTTPHGLLAQLGDTRPPALSSLEPAMEGNAQTG